MHASERDRVRAYHERTKHRPERYAASLGYMDWANQPEPFRFYEGAPRVRLPLLAADPPAGRMCLYEPGEPPAALDLPHLAGFLELSVALSAWKASGGARWPLRINPSSGNLHPTETHLVLPPLQGCSAGVYHYDPLHHALECRAHLPEETAPVLGGGFLVGLTSIFWREAWKYGERAFRYCQLDIGHAMAALRCAAGIFGWRLGALSTAADDEISAVLGLDGAAYPPGDEEEPEALLRVRTDGRPAEPEPPPGLIRAAAALRFSGRPNRLSREHVGWEAIADVAGATRKPRTAAAAEPAPPREWVVRDPAPPAARIVRQRRSAVAMTRGPDLPRLDLLSMLDKTLPRAGAGPFDACREPVGVHLVLFVHAVAGVEPGLYFLARSAAGEHEGRALLPDAVWEAVEPGFPLYTLRRGDLRRTATLLSCGQEIAGEGVFAVGMLARFADTIAAAPFRYRHLFWECGMIGQILYLEAEAHGLRGTGIGCFYDDEVHECLGLADDRWQSLYHFTVGHPVEDRRLTTLPPY